MTGGDAMRELFRQGVRWAVHEASAARTPGAQASRCLIFDSEGIVRRLWAFPEQWAQLSDQEILGLLDAPPTPALGIRAVRHSGSHPTVIAAIAAHAHAQELVVELMAVREATRTLDNERTVLLESCRKGRHDLRIAVQQYVKTLKRGGVPPERAVALLKLAIEDGLGGLTAREMPANEDLIDAGVRWGIEAYYAA
jgi:hypothetical protein